MKGREREALLRAEENSMVFARGMRANNTEHHNSQKCQIRRNVSHQGFQLGWPLTHRLSRFALQMTFTVPDPCSFVMKAKDVFSRLNE